MAATGIYNRISEQLDYNPISGVLTWKVSNNTKIKVGSIAGSKDDKGYINIKIDGKVYLAHRLAYLLYYGHFPEKGLDHKDRIRHHNWILNLRETSQQCNIRNTGNFSTNTSGVKGVGWDKQRKKWYARIINLKQKFLGYYVDFDEAVCARLAGEQCVNWSGCDSTSPAYLYVKKTIQGGK